MTKGPRHRKVRYAVIGLGHLAQVAVLPAFKSSRNSELAALVSGDPKKLSTLGRKYGITSVYSYDQLEECLAHDIDAAYIVLPNHLHREFTIRAANAGAHVLCEKPMAASVADCRAMMTAARKNRRKLMIAYRLHFEKGNLEAIRAARQGELGELRFFSSDFAQQVVKDNVRLTQPVKAGGGPVYDMGVYCINAARYLFGEEPTEVFATSASSSDPRFQRAEEMTTAVLRFPGERIATFTASFGAADIDRYSLIGTKGILTAAPGYGYAAGTKMEIERGARTTKRTFPKRDQFAAEISYFSDCILNNREPEPSGEEGLADVRVVEAIYRAAKSGAVVKLRQTGPSRAHRRPSLRQNVHRPAHGKPRTVNVKSPSGKAA